LGDPSAQLKGMERQLLEGAWTQVREEVEAQLVPLPGGTETYVLCRSIARRIWVFDRGIVSEANLAQRVQKGQLNLNSEVGLRSYFAE
jgi:hypothetical protein